MLQQIQSALIKELNNGNYSNVLLLAKAYKQLSLVEANNGFIFGSSSTISQELVNPQVMPPQVKVSSVAMEIPNSPQQPPVTPVVTQYVYPDGFKGIKNTNNNSVARQSVDRDYWGR